MEYGGTGFYYDTAPSLPDEIEHHKPDYSLYDGWVADRIADGVKPKELQYYTDFSIGFTTRGCIRGCSFCVNKNYRECKQHSPVSEFLDPNRKYICLLDDNVLSCRDWKEIFEELQATEKRFQFKQGMDERLLTDEKCEVIFRSKWIGDYIFAFDNIKDARIVEKKLQLMRQHTRITPKFYVFCGYDHNDRWDCDFWRQDLIDVMRRIEILLRYEALPYIMRFNRYTESPWANVYVQLARWCNQPAQIKKRSFREFCGIRGGAGIGYRSLVQAETDIPELTPYFDMKWGQFPCE